MQPLLTAPKSGEHVDVEILTRSKDEAENKKLFEKIIELIGQGVRVTRPSEELVRFAGHHLLLLLLLLLLLFPSVLKRREH